MVEKDAPQSAGASHPRLSPGAVNRSISGDIRGRDSRHRAPVSKPEDRLDDVAIAHARAARL